MSRKIIEQFVASLDAEPDLSAYKDPEFCIQIQKEALQAISTLLIHIYNLQIIAQRNNAEFNLKLALNIKDPETGLTLLDYCVIGGVDKLAYSFATKGATTTVKLNKFAENIRHIYTEEKPELIQKIEKVIKKITMSNLLQEQALVGGNAKEISNWQLLKQKIYNIRQETNLMFLVGVACIIGSIFAGGVGTAVLNAIGIPLVIASLNSMQNTISQEEKVKFIEANYRKENTPKLIKLWLEANKDLMKIHFGSDLEVNINDDYELQANDDALLFRVRSEQPVDNMDQSLAVLKNKLMRELKEKMLSAQGPR